MAAVAEAEALRLQLGGIKQQMAKANLEADKAKETAEEMRAHVNKLNQNFIQTSELLCRPATTIAGVPEPPVMRAAVHMPGLSSCSCLMLLVMPGAPLVCLHAVVGWVVTCCVCSAPQRTSCAPT